ncbi:MAG: hypothetical protein L6V82_08725 [Clostridiales bacterium]|nr:MAG: hypothetical protein L6V82_08725 [Clostridiales bacterium]
MTSKKNKGGNVGKVYRGRTKYIDVETKPERDYVVVIDDGERVKVAKLKSIKIFDENGKNADKALVEINSERYGLKCVREWIIKSLIKTVCQSKDCV